MKRGCCGLRAWPAIMRDDPKRNTNCNARPGKDSTRQKHLVFVTELDSVSARWDLHCLEGVVGSPQFGRLSIHIRFPPGIVGLGNYYHRLCWRVGLDRYRLVRKICTD